jgi:predicted Fe-Mo cluster-binding NifX family protein
LKVAVSSTGGTLESQVDPRFGRSPYHLIVDTESLSFETIQNSNMHAPSGVGIGAAQEVAKKGIKAVLTGNVGPNASMVLSKAGIEIFTGATGSVKQAVEAYINGNLSPAPAVGESGFGYVRGGGTGRGMGMGRGRGMLGMGRRMYNYPSQQPTSTQPATPISKEQEKEVLANQLDQLERELKEVKKKLEELG